MNIQDVVARFNTIPILFAGSGITRRYYDLPDWKGLLTEFTSRVNADRFAYRAYESKAHQLGYTQGIMPKIATLIQQDFDSKWYSTPEMRTNDSFVLNAVGSGCSPFKAEIAWYLKGKSIPQPAFKDEIQKLKNISKKNLAGVITTNYDTFFEKLFDDYTPYIGQNQERFVFVDYKPGASGYSISTSTLAFGEQMLSMTRLTLSDFSILYDALAAKKASVPVKLLRRFKEEIYTYAVTSKPGPLLMVADLDDKNIDENKLAISIGVSNTGEFGLLSIVDTNEWYRSIVLDEIERLKGFNADQLLQYAYPQVKKGTVGDIPVYKYLAQAKEDYPEIRAVTPNDFEKLTTATNKKYRYTTDRYPSLASLWDELKDDKPKAFRIMCCFPENKIDVDYLGKILQSLFEQNDNALEQLDSITRTNVRRLIRMYDYLKWGKK